MHELAEQIWRLEKTIVLSQLPAADPDAPLDDIGAALLEFVRDTPGAYAAQIAQRLAISRPAMTKRLRSLVAAGLLDTVADDSDGRRMVVTLTERGGAVLERGERLRSDNAAGYVADWTAVDRRALVALLQRLNDEIERAHHRDTPGWARAAGGVR